MHSIYYSEIVMYIATSLGLDSAVFDKPQIIVSFDGWEDVPYVRSVKRYHNEDNLRSLIKLGGTKVVESRDNLIRSINEYLVYPEHQQEGRNRIIEKLMHKIDGKAGERIASVIINCLKDEPSN